MRRAIVALLVVLFGITAGALASRPAQAAYGDCYNYPGTVCLTANANWGTPVWRQYPSQINGCRSLTPEGFNDKATMVRNGSGLGVLVVWEHYNCTGNWFSVPSGQWTDLSGNWWNDEASAVEFTLA